MAGRRREEEEEEGRRRMEGLRFITFGKADVKAALSAHPLSPR